MAQQQTVFKCHGLVVELDPAVEDDSGDSTSIPSNDAVGEANGITYHGSHRGSYFLPNDAMEQDRLDLQHEMVLMLMDGRLGLAPVRSPKHVLDIATGTGIWAIQYAEQNPGANVVGTDLSIIQRKTDLPNLSFVQQDVERDDWAFDQKFDYIHLRFILTCFEDTKSVIQKAFDNLNPGGYIEFFDLVATKLDFDGTMQGTAYDRWSRLVIEGGKKIGRDLDKATLYPKWCREVGFVDVEEKLFPQPCGTWAKDPKMKQTGTYSMHNQLALVGRSLSKFLEFAGLPQGQHADLVNRAKQDLRNPKLHFGIDYRVTYGRKPE